MEIKKFLDEVGLGHTWSKIKSLLNGKADTDLNNVTNDNFRDKAIDAGVGGLQTVTASSTDGVTYTATVTGVTALTAGLTIVIIPNVVSASISAKLNVNGLGDKYIRQSTTNNSATGLTPKNAGWMAANKPITIQYDGTQWKTIAARSNASDMNGTVAIANGGTGATTKADAQTNLGLNDAIVGLSVSGKTITYTQADGGTGTITTQDTNTTYSAMSAAEAKAGTATTARTITAAVLSKFAKVPDYSTKTQWTFAGTTYTAPSDGWVLGVLNADGSGTDSSIHVNGTNVTWGNDKNPIVSFPVCKGDKVYAAYNHTDMYYYSCR